MHRVPIPDWGGGHGDLKVIDEALRQSEGGGEHCSGARACTRDPQVMLGGCTGGEMLDGCKPPGQQRCPSCWLLSRGGGTTLLR